ncbi:hypothetical protein KLF26_09815 [Clostridium perfringens]|uniref:hypothetical protein n=1 Tax=Clostridium perfringens TaxID=1502 RepID=UPI001CCBB246|nr:hypothetical protein [Clostridium perfringens]UBK99507.1 hypothetical protein KLF26_09815 [Clostridium perfringens]
MVMNLEEFISRFKIIACFKEAKQKNEEAKEALQLMNWLIELKNFKEEEKKKLDLLNNIIEDKNTEIENQELRIEKLEEELELLKSNRF